MHTDPVRDRARRRVDMTATLSHDVNDSYFLDELCDERATVIEVCGYLDIYTVPKLRELVNEAVSRPGGRLIVSLLPAEFMDSTALGVLVLGLKRMVLRGGTFYVVCDQERFTSVFRMTGLGKVIRIFSAIGEALTYELGNNATSS